MKLRKKIGMPLLIGGMLIFIATMGACTVGYTAYLNVRSAEDKELNAAAKLTGEMKTLRARAFEQGNPPEMIATVVAYGTPIAQHYRQYEAYHQYRHDLRYDPYPWTGLVWLGFITSIVIMSVAGMILD